MMGDHLVRFGEGSSTNAFNMCLGKNKYIDIYIYLFIHSIQLHEGLSTKHVLPLYFSNTKYTWERQDSNLRRKPSADLQSVAFNHSATLPTISKLIFGATRLRRKIGQSTRVALFL
jgi:hypothetical protein